MMIMGSSKNLKKSRWFMVCFKPNEEPIKPKKGSQESTSHQKILIALSNEKPDSSPDNNVASRTMSEKSRRRRFPRVFKAIFSDTTSSLSKKKRNKKSGKDTSRSSSNNSSKFEKIFNTSSEKKSESLLSSSSKESSDTDTSVLGRSSLFSSTAVSSSRSSSSFSSISSVVRTGSERKQVCTVDLKEFKPNKPVSLKKKKESGNCNPESGLYFMLICLVGLIFWGKAFAIFCTSTCLFLVPCLSKGVALEVNDVDSIDVDSDEYKKKVIMEGLLERNRTRKL